VKMTYQSKQTKRAQVLGALRQSFAKLSEKERHTLAADLGIIPVFNIRFVKGVDGRPEGENHA
jgi:hypothetical protein